MTISKFLLCATFALTASVLGGCGDDGASGTAYRGEGREPVQPSRAPSGVPVGFRFECDAALKTTKFDYLATATTLSVVAGETRAYLKRLAGDAGSNPVFGVWEIPTTIDVPPTLIAEHELSVEAAYRIEANQVTLTTKCGSKYANLTATVSSPAKVTDKSVEILENHSVKREWTETTGDRIVSIQSFDAPGTGSEPARFETAHLGAVFPNFRARAGKGY